MVRMKNITIIIHPEQPDVKSRRKKMKVTSIEINAKDMKDPKEAAEKIMEALGIGGGVLRTQEILT